MDRLSSLLDELSLDRMSEGLESASAQWLLRGALALAAINALVLLIVRG